MPRPLTIAVLLLAFAAPAAHAQGANAPPGNSGVDEYLESVPAASGNTPTGGKHAPQSGKQAPVLTKQQQRALAAQGADGAAAAALAERFGVPRAERDVKSKQRPGRAPAKEAADAPRQTPAHGSSAFESLSKTVLPSSDAGGLGPLLPIVLVGIAALGGGAALVRRRRAQ